MGKNADDMSAFDTGGAVASPDTLEALHEKLDQAVALEDKIAQMDEDRKAASKLLNEIKSIQIPDMMTSLQLEELVKGSYHVKIQDFVSGSLPKAEDKKQAAIDWLEAHDGAEIIKTKVSADFGRSEHNAALNAAAVLEETGAEAHIENGVHAQTLQKFARERIENGEPIDTEVLGLYTGKVAKFRKLKDK